MAIRYDKLVRDRVPGIIRDNGGTTVTHVATSDEYVRALKAKLQEEVNEFLESGTDVRELADIMEVVYALARHMGVDADRLDALRLRKLADRGGFTQRIILEEA